jgi:hypothetical protein
MPDFDTQKPQEPNEPGRLRTLLSAHQHRILSLANEFRTLMLTNWLRTALIGVGIFFFVIVVVPGGLLVYQSSGISDELSQLLAHKQANQSVTVTCNKEYLIQGGACIVPSEGNGSIVCEAESRAQVEKQGYCRKGNDTPYVGGETVTCDSFLLGKTGVCSAPTVKPYLVCRADSRYEVDDETYCRSSY